VHLWISSLAVVLAAACEDAPVPRVAATVPEPVDTAVAGGAHVAEPADSQVTTERPLRLRLPSGSVLAVDVAATDPQGTLVIPELVARAGWWQAGARLGDPFGAIVIAAHVDSFAEGIGPIAELLGVESGDVVRLEARNLSQSFAVNSSTFVRRTSLADHAATLSFVGAHRLVLITCGGPYDRTRGGYRDNLIVVAEPDSPLEQK
jgi:Sortase domain